jgi:oligo-1,6-glucosidase/alpha-glucosidase
MDTNGDGIGDLQGVISKLDYLQELGIDLIWLGPVYESPNDDNGYDISNYQKIHPDFGSMDDFDELLDEVHRRGMKLIMDLVLNHTSDEHPWFMESRTSTSSPYRDYYIWRKGKNGKEPNNWESIFGGSAWAYDEQTEEYYLHIFSKKQPDLNWENPSMRKDLYGIVNWWLDKGIDGFRVDAISHIKKKPGLPDLPNPKDLDYVPSYRGHMNQPGIHPLLQELKKQTFRNYDIVTVGEANGVAARDAEAWVGEEKGAFDMIFQFEHLDLWGTARQKSVNLPALKRTLTAWQEELDGKGWNALFMENHDQPRAVSSWGNPERYHYESATAIAVLYFLMQGTPFIYQGQEIGMTNVKFPDISDYDDIRMRQYYELEQRAGTPEKEIMETIWATSRDNARTPMQWNDKSHAGFTDSTPWISTNPNYKHINVESQLEEEHSILTFYQALIQLRKEREVLIYGSYQLILKNHPSIYAYKRHLGNEEVLVLVNFSSKQTLLPPGTLPGKQAKLLLANYENRKLSVLEPYETRVYEIK